MVVRWAKVQQALRSTLLPEEPAGALDLTGMRPESQLACCDMVYKFLRQLHGQLPASPQRTGEESGGRSCPTWPKQRPLL